MAQIRDQRREATPRRRPVIFNNDGFGIRTDNGGGTPQDLLSQLQPDRNPVEVSLWPAAQTSPVVEYLRFPVQYS
jgi:hypothetical protein